LVNFNENQGLFQRLGGQDLSERDMKSARDAFDVFKELTTRFPQSRYSAEARQRMNYLVNSIAAGEVHVARYYFRRGAYVAAVNRTKEVIRAYSDAPAIEEAMYIMWRSYLALGVTDLADDAERVMRLNFPKSEFYVTGVNLNDRRWWQVWK
jgi:outer membrane protein assembly factor BamD